MLLLLVPVCHLVKQMCLQQSAQDDWAFRGVLSDICYCCVLLLFACCFVPSHSMVSGYGLGSKGRGPLDSLQLCIEMLAMGVCRSPCIKASLKSSSDGLFSKYRGEHSMQLFCTPEEAEIKSMTLGTSLHHYSGGHAVGKLPDMPRTVISPGPVERLLEKGPWR